MPDPFAGVASPVQAPQSADPFAGVASAVQAPQAAPSNGWQPTQYGFKVRPGMTPDTGKPTVEREDGAYYYGPEQGNPNGASWMFKDPKTGLSVPAPSQPWAQKGVLSSQFGADTLAHYGRNLKEGWNSAMSGLYGLGSDVAHALGAESDQDYIKGIQRVEEQQRYAQALRNTGGPTASTAQFTGQAAPALAMTAVAPAAVPALAETAGLPYASQLAANALPLAAATYATTPGSQSQKVIAGTEAGAGSALGQAAVQKVIAPIASAAGEAIGTAYPKVGSIARMVAEKLGLPTTTPNISMAPANILDRFMGKVEGMPSDVVQQDLIDQYAAARARGGAPFRALRAEGGTVELPQYEAALDDALTTAQNSRGGVDADTISALKKLQAGATNPNAPKDWGSALDVGTAINDEMGQAIQSGNNNLKRILGPIKDAHQADLDAAGSQFGERYQQAKQAWIDNVVPWEDPQQGGRLLKSFMKSPTPDTAMDALLKAKSEDKVGYFVKQLSPDKGIPALQAGLVQSVYNQALNDEGTAIIPSKFISAMNQRANAYGLSFTGEAKWTMDGLNTLMKDSRFLSKLGSGETIMSMIPGNRVLPGSRFPVPNSGETIQKLLTTPLGRKLLLDASSFKPGSAALGDLINTQLPKIIGSSAPNVVPLATPRMAFGEVANQPSQNQSEIAQVNQ